MKAVRCVWVCIMAVLAGCSEPEPIRLGLIAGLSGKHADLGTECRNGVQLAVEEQNARGGIQGSALILLARDDHSSAAEASKQVAQLDEQERVMALLGPALSGVAVGILEDINRRRLVTMGLTTTSNQLSDKDDFYFRIISPTRQHASVSARYMRQRAQVFDYVAIYDVTNRAYTESWLNDFSRTFVQSGGHEVERLPYDGDRDKVRELVTRANAHGADLVVLVMGATDAALMIKEIRTARPDQAVMTSEWAATPTFVGLAGRYAEGVYTPQYLDIHDQSPRYRAFVKAYRERFGKAPGYPAMISYDATRLLLLAIEKAGGKKGALKAALQSFRQFEGVQATIEMSPTGDGTSPTYMTRIQDGEYQTVD